MGPKPLLPLISVVSDMVGLLSQFAGEEVADDGRDLWSLAFEREMTRFEQMDLGIRIVLPERLGAIGQEKWIVLAPHGQQRRLG
jgi:hypothetical protein